MMGDVHTCPSFLKVDEKLFNLVERSCFVNNLCSIMTTILLCYPLWQSQGGGADWFYPPFYPPFGNGRKKKEDRAETLSSQKGLFSYLK